MESFVITWRELLIVVVVVLAIYMAEMLLLLRGRKAGEPRSRAARGAADSAQERLAQLESELEDVLRRLEVLERGRESSEPPPHVPPPVAQTPYSHAIQLAREGRDADAVAASCGISRGEAELIVAMHRARAP